jgi:glutamyl-tRNA synthetase
MKDRSKRTVELAETSRYFFVDPAEYDPQAAKKNFTPESAELLRALREKLSAAGTFDRASLESMYRRHAESAGLAAGKLIHATRLAISGVSFGPGLFEMMETLGKERVVRRIDKAIAWVLKNGR